MSKFEQAIDTILEHEGYYSNDAADPGGATKYGISLRFLRSLGEDLGDVDRDGDVDMEDIRGLTLEKAKGLYRSQWWDKYRYAAVLDQKVATKVFDLAVNVGASQAHKLVQRAVNRSIDSPSETPSLDVLIPELAIDGKLGSKSYTSINLVQPPILLRLIADEAASFYIDLTFRRIAKMGLEAGGKYLKGWIRRAWALI